VDGAGTFRHLAIEAADGSLILVVAQGPAGASGHGEEETAAWTLDPEGGATAFGEALLSTQYDVGGNPTRLGLELWPEGEEQTVRVYDGSHGVNELHRYNRRGQKQSAEVFHPGTLGGGNALCDQADRGWLRGDDRVMAEDLRDLPARTPAQRIAHEAVELAIEGRSPYPANSVFIDAEETWTGREIKKAVDEGRAVVLVYPDSSTRILRAEVAAS